MAIVIQDSLHVLTPSVMDLKPPFEVKVITGQYPSVTDLDADVSRSVTEPGLFVVGIDPIHHWSSVHFGKELNIPKDLYSHIRKAGSTYFQENHWSEGVSAIVNRATEVWTKEHSRVTTLQKESQDLVITTPLVWGCIAIVGVIVLGVVLILKAKLKSNLDRESLLEVRRENDSQRERISNTYNPVPVAQFPKPTPNYSPKPTLKSSTQNYSPKPTLKSSTPNYSPKPTLKSSTPNYSPRSTYNDVSDPQTDITVVNIDIFNSGSSSFDSGSSSFDSGGDCGSSD